MIKNRQRWLVAVAVVVISLMAGVVALRPQPALPTLHQPSPNLSTVRAGPTSIETRLTRLPAEAAARDNPYWVETRAQNLTEAFRRLIRIDDPAAAAAAHRISSMCAMYADHLYPRILASIENGEHSPSTKERQLAAAARQRARCIGFTDGDITAGSERNRYLQERDDPRVFAHKIRQSLPDGPFAKAKQAAELHDPSAIEELGAYFLNRYDRGRQPVYDLGNGVVATPRLLHNAFMLAACDFGEDCGPNNGFVIAQCVNAGRCEAASVEEVFLRYFHTGADSERLLAAAQAISIGLHTGRWPADLWTPPPVLPPYIRQAVEDHERQQKVNGQ